MGLIRSWCWSEFVGELISHFQLSCDPKQAKPSSLQLPVPWQRFRLFILRLRASGLRVSCLKHPNINTKRIWEFPKIRGTLFWGPYNKDPTIYGTTLGSPISETLICEQPIAVLFQTRGFEVKPEGPK